MTKAVSNRQIFLIKAVLLLCEHGPKNEKRGREKGNICIINGVKCLIISFLDRKTIDIFFASPTASMLAWKNMNLIDVWEEGKDHNA